MSDRRALSEEQLFELLRLHHQTAPDPAEADLELIALAHAGVANEAEAQAAAEALRSKPELVETMLALSAIEARGILPPLFRRSSSIHPRALVALGVALAASIAAVVAVPSWFPERSALSPKGGAEELALAVERSGRRFTARPGDLLLQGDHLGLFYSAPAPGYLAILYRDQAAKVTALFPAGEGAGASAAIEAGVHRAVPDGAIVEEGTGCEWFVAVFSAQPLAIAELEKAVAGAEPAGDGCRLSVNIPRARVHIFDVRR